MARAVRALSSAHAPARQRRSPPRAARLRLFDRRTGDDRTTRGDAPPGGREAVNRRASRMINSGFASATSMPSPVGGMKARENRPSNTRVTCAGAFTGAHEWAQRLTARRRPARRCRSRRPADQPAPLARRSASSDARAERRPSTTMAPTEAPAADSTARSQPSSISMRSRNAPRTPSRSR